MKRPGLPEPTQQEASIERWYTIFRWCKCFMCKREFRREAAWRTEKYFPFGEPTNTPGVPGLLVRYCCLECSPTREKFWNHLIKADAFRPPKGGSGTAPAKSTGAA